MKTITPSRSPKPSEEGYLLVSVIFMLALLMIALAVAAPKVARQIQRDHELETMHRGKQYIRAVKLYYKQFGAYPPNVDALVKTNEIRFLRRKYVDPTTGKEEWKVIHLGQNKAPTAMGFFGQPLTGAGMGGGLCGNALPNSTPSGSSSFGSSGSGSSGSGFSSGFSSGSSGSGFGTSSPTAGCPSTNGSSSSTDPNAAANGSTDPNAASGNSGSQSANGSPATGSGTGSTSSIGQTGQTFGGAGIMGFSPNSPKQSILSYKKKNHYNEWEFVYDPMADQMMMQGGNTGALGGNPATGGTGGSGIGGSGIGGSGIGGSGIGGGGIGSGSTFGSGTGSSSGSGSGSTTPPQQ